MFGFIIQRSWRSIKRVKPTDTGAVLVSHGSGVSIAWWARDWAKWCKVGSRDILRLTIDHWDTHWMYIPSLPSK